MKKSKRSTLTLNNAPTPKLSTLTFNLTNTAIRHETLQGKAYIVAPVAMLTEGVHAGSGGALLYTENECKRAVQAWNMKPVVVYHPEINGQGVTACAPDVLERQQVGMVMNTVWNGKLRAEAWIEEERAALVDNRVIEALENNSMMEVSTGLFTDNIGEPGEFNGTAYNAEATNHQPDHLALLPDKIGACSIADGAGLLQMNEAAQTRGVDVTRLLAREMDTIRRMVGNAMSHSDVSNQLREKVRDMYPGDGENRPYIWVVDVFDKYFVFEKGENELYRLDYTKKKGVVEVSGEPQTVARVIKYEFVGNQTTPQQPKEKGMKETLVNALIANASTQWGEDDRTSLMGMDEAVLNKMAPFEKKKMTPEEEEAEKAKKKAKKTTDNAEATVVPPVTMEAYIQAAPEELRDVLTNGLQAHQTQKDALIAKITGNTACSFTPEFLATKGLQELQGLAALAAPVAPATTGAVPMFTGAATPAAPVGNAAPVEEEGLAVPTMNFGTDA